MQPTAAYVDEFFAGADVAVQGVGIFDATAIRLSRFRRKTIARLTREQPLVRRAAFALRRCARGPSKLGRRLRRRSELGRAGSF